MAVTSHLHGARFGPAALSGGMNAALLAGMILVYLIIAAFALLALEGPQHVHDGT
jgi:hypothetical protein